MKGMRFDLGSPSAVDVTGKQWRISVCSCSQLDPLHLDGGTAGRGLRCLGLRRASHERAFFLAAS